MEFGFTPQQEMIRNEASSFLSRECAIPLVRELMESERAHDDSLWEKMASMGWMGLIFPERYDGVGLSFVELSILMEQMGAVLLPGAYFSTVVLAGLTLLETANDAQKEKWLAPLAAGSLKATLALTEPNGSWSLGRASAVKARREGDDYLITGTKLFVPDAEVADLIICAARGEDEALILFAIDRNSDGLRVTPLKTMDQTRRVYEVTFEGVRASRGRLLDGSHNIEASLERVLDNATIALSAQMVGGAQRVLEMSVEYSKTRIQFNKPIGSFQAIQHRCADMLLLVESARSAVYAAACNAAESKQETGLLASIAKAYTNDAYGWTAGEGIQIHGGMGFTFEHDAHLYYKRAKADEFTFGDSNFHLDRVARLIGL
jgi:alkylation response protein AidB-like acyl-CoA dehydrogenase